MTTQQASKKINKNGATMFEDQEKTKYKNLYKNIRQNTKRTWSAKDIILSQSSELFKQWVGLFEGAEHTSSMEKEAGLLCKLGIKIISPGTHLNTPLLHSYIPKYDETKLHKI